MNSKRKKFLVWSVLVAVISAFVGTVVKMLVTDQWPSLRPLVSTSWDWISAVLTWLDQPVMLPHWAIIAVSMLLVLLMGILIWSLSVAGGKLIAAQEKIASLQSPSVPPLTENQDKVIAAIASYDSVGVQCPVNEFPTHIGMSLLHAQGAMDVLEKRKMISYEYSSECKYVTLTAAGREYVLRPEFDMPSLPSS